MQQHFESAALDEGLYRRLSRRYGPEITFWLETLPTRLRDLADRWQVTLGRPVGRGTVSAVLNCTDADGRSAILKISPDRPRITAESDALEAWRRTPRVPDLIARDTDHGALLIEAIRPGIALDESGTSPSTADLAALLNALHEDGPQRSVARPLQGRIRSLFDSGAPIYARRPDLEEVVPKALYEHGRRAAEALATRPPEREVALHGDLTPANVLDGGSERGFVAVDPAPC